MLAKRIATALVLLAVVVGTLWISENVFLAAIGLAFAITLFEWLRIEKVSVPISGACSFVAAGAMVWVGLSGFNPEGLLFLTLELIVSCFWLAIVAVCFNARMTGFRVARNKSILFAFLFVAAAFLSLVWLTRTGGWPLTLSVFAIAWVADIFAFFVGIAFGRHRMAPAISPKKSWEGALGAYVCVFLAALASWMYLPHEMVLTSRLFAQIGPVVGFLVVFLLVSVSIAGDLFESELKRIAGVKDSGWLLPGHGGFYDRLDSALAVFPVGATLLLIL